MQNRWSLKSTSITLIGCNVLHNCFPFPNQCDQVGEFLKVLGNKVPCKSSQNI